MSNNDSKAAGLEDRICEFQSLIHELLLMYVLLKYFQQKGLNISM